jgi:hypothetical protein
MDVAKRVTVDAIRRCFSTGIIELIASMGGPPVAAIGRRATPP